MREARLVLVLLLIMVGCSSSSESRVVDAPPVDRMKPYYVWNRAPLEGKPDLWPAMLVLNVMQSYYEATGDKRVLAFMARYFRWEMDCPKDQFLAGFWPKMRAGDNLESIYWLYNRTGESWLLD